MKPFIDYPEQKKIIEKYKAGVPILDLAREYSVNKSTIQNYLRNSGTVLENRRKKKPESKINKQCRTCSYKWIGTEFLCNYTEITGRAKTRLSADGLTRELYCVDENGLCPFYTKKKIKRTTKTFNER